MKRLVLTACGGLLLASCQEEGRLHATQRPDGQIEFSASYQPVGDQPCINSISVMHDEGGRRVEDWYASRQDPSLCRDRIVYGRAGPGFRTGAPPRPLVPNQHYEVSVNGSGLAVGGTFRLTDAGLEFVEL